GGLENVSIAYSSAIPHRFLVLLRIQLAADFPMMRVNFLVRNRNEIKEGLQNGEYQFGIVNVHDSRAIHSLDATFLGHFEFVPFFQKGGELASVAPDRVLTALRNSKQFVLRSLIEEGMGEKVIVS
ncbi:LysR family transcriptional regulator, partial [Vibrio parahaemolyticus]|uniref:LysR substrate-binding domain-containing protein n=2 Tax=Vibrio TaxID=662 RepID=UPI0017AD65AE|nr:LysR family transcriptional regulator [Vibrio parahaemolyticus]